MVPNPIVYIYGLENAVIVRWFDELVVIKSKIGVNHKAFKSTMKSFSSYINYLITWNLIDEQVIDHIQSSLTAILVD